MANKETRRTGIIPGDGSLSSNRNLFSHASFSIYSDAGVTVTKVEALKDPTVVSCINIIAQSISQLNWHVYDVAPDYSRTINYKHKANEVLRIPNPYNTPYELKYRMVFDLMSEGDSFTNTKRYSDSGRPGPDEDTMYLFPLETSRITASLDGNFNPTYSQSGGKGRNGGDSRYLAHEMLHIMDVNKNGYSGTSRLEQAAVLVGMARAADKAAGAGFKNASSIGGFLSYEGKLTAEQKDQLSIEWAKFTSGSASNAGKTTPILETGVGGGLTFERLDLNAADMTLLEFKKFIVRQIAGLYRVPLHLLEIDETGKASTIIEKNLSFYRDTIFPLTKNISERMTRNVLKSSDRLKYCIDFDSTGVSKGDPKSMVEFVSSSIMASVMTPNEGREYLGFNRMDDERMDEIFFNTSTQQMVSPADDTTDDTTDEEV